MAILFLTPYLYEKYYPPEPQTPPSKQVEETSKPEVSALSEETEARGTEIEEPAEATRVIEPTEASPQQFEVENEDLILTFDNAGAILSSVHLKKYRSGSGDLVEVVSGEIPHSVGRTLAIEVSDEVLNESLERALYRVKGLVSDRMQAPAEIEFEFRQGELQVWKKIQIPASGYQLRVWTEVSRQGRGLPFRLVVGSGIGSLDPLEASDFAYPQIVLNRDGSLERWDEGDLEEGATRLATTPRWLAVDSQYFAYALIQPSPLDFVELSRAVWEEPEVVEGSEASPRAIPLLSLRAGSRQRLEATFFIGPKDSEILKRVDPSLAELIDYGWFGVLVRPLLFCLKVLNGFLHNYGWSIILLTFLINLVLFPIRFKQMASMKKMTDLQPKLRSIQDKYKRMKKDDPRRQQMNQEVMALYRDHGVNPLGGCLPLLIQMPFLFAFYRMLASSMELRGAPFILWIQDLSRPDPYYATPIIMGLSMVFQQKITPAVGDPSQRRMMMILPLVFTFFFLNVSSGLALYFLFSNLFGIILQLGVQRWRPELMAAGQKGKKEPAKKKKRESARGGG